LGLYFLALCDHHRSQICAIQMNRIVPLRETYACQMLSPIHGDVATKNTEASVEHTAICGFLLSVKVNTRTEDEFKLHENRGMLYLGILVAFT
jgi:hypothetical protein